MCYNREPAHTEVYRGYTIEIWQDQSPSNPYDDTDGMYPMMVKGDRDTRKEDYKDAGNAFMPHWKVYRRHKAKLVEALSIDVAEIKRSWKKQDVADQTYTEVCDAISQAVKEHDYDTLEKVGDILGIPCLQKHLTGYSQSSWMDVLVVCTPQFTKESGVTKKQALDDGSKSMELNAKIYGAWAWGDVYGFIIKGPDGEKTEEGSVWGFLEPEPFPIEKTYVMQEARMEVDAEIKHKLKTHLEKLKRHIRAHVPLQHREHLTLR